MKNTNKLAIVVGSSGGIGSEIVRHFLANDYQVVGIDKENDHQFSATEYIHYTCDVKNFQQLQTIIEHISFQNSNALINCAGIREICSISDLSIAQWEEVFAVNVSSVFISSKAFSEKLISKQLSGSIITIASVSGMLGEPNRTAYVSSKHAILGLTKQLAIEYGKFGIRANAISPGVIRTPLTEIYYDDPEQMKKIASGQFIPYFATPKDIAPLAMFLASDAARFITGSSIVADGGWSAGKLI